MKFFLVISLALFHFCAIFSQNTSKGYWDESASISKESIIAAGESSHLSIPIPKGTTDVIFQITFIAPDAKQSESLISLLKKIPAPQTVLFASLMEMGNTLYGDWTANYALYNDKNKTNACKSGSISNQVKIHLSAKTSNCIKLNNNLFLSIKNTNSFFSGRAIVEAVPFVNTEVEAAINGLERESELFATRQIAAQLGEAGNYAESIETYQYITDVMGKGVISDYINLGWYCILNKQFLLALKYLEKANNIDAYNLTVKGNLAHAYLLNGEYEKATEIYQKYKGQKMESGKLWEHMIIKDFDTFENNGIINNRFTEITQTLSK